MDKTESPCQENHDSSTDVIETAPSLPLTPMAVIIRPLSWPGRDWVTATNASNVWKIISHDSDTHCDAKDLCVKGLVPRAASWEAKA